MSSSYAPQSSNPNAGGGNQWLPTNQNQSRSAAGASLMLSAILSLIFVVIVISIHLYTRYRRQYESNDVITIIHSRIPPAGQAGASAAVSKGLDAATIEKLPTFPYRRPERGGGAAECAVCLSAAEEGEMVRMLPECKHLFHVGCIDMWLYSHSTCPVCRGEAKVVAAKFVFGEVVAAPTVPERVGGADVLEATDENSESQRRWVLMVDGERDLERQ